MKRSVTRMSPPAARATPESSRIPADADAPRRPARHDRAGCSRPTARWRARERLGDEDRVPRQEARARGFAGRVDEAACRARRNRRPSRRRGSARLLARRSVASCTTAVPVTAGAREPDATRRTRGRARSRPESPATPVTTKSVRPGDRVGRLAERRRDAAVGVVDRRHGRDTDGDARRRAARRAAGRLRAGPVTRARRTRRKPLTRATVPAFRRASWRSDPRASRRPGSASRAGGSRRAPGESRRAAARTSFSVAAVEVAGRLVGQQQPRPGRQRPRDRDPLHLAARELVGVGRGDGGPGRRAPGARAPARRRRPSPSRRRGSSTFSRTVRWGRRLKNWKTTPTSRRRYSTRSRSASAARSRPPTTRRPPVGRSMPARRWSSVDLPLPDSPTSARNCPAERPDPDRRGPRRPGPLRRLWKGRGRRRREERMRARTRWENMAGFGTCDL